MAASVGMLMMLISMFVFDYFDLAMCFVTVNIISTSSLIIIKTLCLKELKVGLSSPKIVCFKFASVKTL